MYWPIEISIVILCVCVLHDNNLRNLGSAFPARCNRDSPLQPLSAEIHVVCILCSTMQCTVYVQSSPV